MNRNNDVGADPTAPIRSTATEPEPARRAARRVAVPGLAGGEVGLGEVIKRATRAVGIKPCAACQRRAEVLDRWLVLTPGSEP